MRLVIQRVHYAQVRIDGQVVGAIERGLLVLLGIAEEDTPADADWLVQKLLHMRIFGDEEGKMNRSLLDEGGNLLVVSQFTLFASTKKGNRPGFTQAAKPEVAIPLYTYFIEQAQVVLGKEVQTGRFGADMQLASENDGPVTILIDSQNRE